MTNSTPLSGSDEELVLQAQGGNLVAMETLFERHQSDILLYLTRLLGERHAERLTLTTFRSAWEALPGLRQPADFVHWLYRIATNIAYDTRYQGPGGRPWPLTPPANEPEGKDPVTRTLYRLAFYDRTSLVLHVVAGFTLTQVASCLGLSQRRIQAHLDTAMQRLMSDPAIHSREEAGVTRLIKALPSPHAHLASPFSSDRVMDESMLSLRRLSTSTSYTRPPYQRMLLRHMLTLTSLLLVISLVSSGLLLLFTNRGQLLSSMNRVQTTPTPTAYDARVDRPLCFFVDPVYDNNSNGGSICNSHLYRDINQQQHAQGGYTLQLQQAYIDNNAFAMAYTLLGPTNSTLDVSVDLNATLSIQGASTPPLSIGRKYAASSTFFGQHNAISDASFYYLPQTAILPSIGNNNTLNMTLEVHSLWLTNQSSGKTLAIHWKGPAPLRYQFSLRESWGEDITPKSPSNSTPYILKRAFVTSSMTHVTLTCTTEAFCQGARSMHLNAGLSTYLPSDTFVKRKTIDIYYRATVFEGNGRWYLIPPASSKQSYIFLART